MNPVPDLNDNVPETGATKVESIYVAGFWSVCYLCVFVYVPYALWYCVVSLRQHGFLPCKHDCDLSVLECLLVARSRRQIISFLAAEVTQFLTGH